MDRLAIRLEDKDKYTGGYTQWPGGYYVGYKAILPDKSSIFKPNFNYYHGEMEHERNLYHWSSLDRAIRHRQEVVRYAKLLIRPEDFKDSTSSSRIWVMGFSKVYIGRVGGEVEWEYLYLPGGATIGPLIERVETSSHTVLKHNIVDIPRINQTFMSEEAQRRIANQLGDQVFDTPRDYQAMAELEFTRLQPIALPKEISDGPVPPNNSQVGGDVGPDPIYPTGQISGNGVYGHTTSG